MKTLKILGTGCPKCRKLEEMVRNHIKRKGLEAEISHVSNINEIMEYGVVMTPALVVDNEIKISGKLPSEKELAKALG
jgi:small redox-active disulfide protein 2